MDADFVSQIKAFYAALDAERAAKIYRTEVGLFYPSRLEHLIQAFSQLSDKGVDSSETLLLEAGSGDGRVVAIAAGLFGIPAVGVESDVDLARKSVADLKSLRSKLALRFAPATILAGDFTDDRLYTTHGFQFSDFRLVFNYRDNERALASKMTRQSPRGAHLLLYDWQIEPTRFDGLIHRFSLELIEYPKHIYSWNLDEPDPKNRSTPPPNVGYAHVYEKR